MQVWAVSALCLPFLATGIYIMSAFSCIWPTVVHSPDNWDTLPCYIAQQDRIVDVVPVEVIQVNDIWLIFVKKVQKPSSCTPRAKTLQTNKAAKQIMQLVLNKRTDMITMLINRLAITIGNTGFNAIGVQCRCYINAYSPGASFAYYSVYLYNLHDDTIKLFPMTG